MLHRGDRVAVGGARFTFGQFEERDHRVTASVKEIVPQVFKRRIAAIERPRTNTRWHLERMNQWHAHDPRIKIDGHLHVVGVQRQMMDAATGRLAGMGSASFGGQHFCRGGMTHQQVLELVGHVARQRDPVHDPAIAVIVVDRIVHGASVIP